jgi:hypothetical protein
MRVIIGIISGWFVCLLVCLLSVVCCPTTCCRAVVPMFEQHLDQLPLVVKFPSTSLTGQLCIFDFFQIDCAFHGALLFFVLKKMARVKKIGLAIIQVRKGYLIVGQVVTC